MSDTGEFELPSIQDIADDALHFGDAAGHFGQDIADGSIAGAVTHAVASDMVTHVVDLGHDASAYRGAGGPLEAAAAKVDFANDMAAIKTDSELLSDFASGETPYTSMHLPDGGEGGGSGTASATAASSEPEFYGDDGAAGGGGTISTTVYPDGSSVSSVDGGDPVYTPAGAYDDAGVTTINPDGSMTTTYADGASATVSDGTGIFADSAPTEDVRIGGYQLDITPLADAWGEANDVAQELMDSGVPIGAAVGLAEALVDGDFEGAAEEVLIGAVDVGADALGLPEIDAGVGFLTDLVEGNTDALLGDAESATIGTVAGLAGATIGSVLGPAGTLLGGEIGGLVGGAVAPSVESVLSDGVGTIE
ncbi:MAG: hypothetical protein JO246_01070, partial [Frankiaceae bacterium]|nr:hypothetical protein [Frankiaceae bacterium]